MTSYYVVVDSEFRDRELYPLETDFGVTFETSSPSGTYPQGQPVDPSQFFPRVTIDKNFESQNIKILNGEITDIKVDPNTGLRYYAGVQRTNANSDNFVILYNEEIIFSDVESITIAKSFIVDEEELQLPFLFKLSGDNKIEWFIIGALSELEYQTYQGYNKTRDVRISINNSSQIFLLYDYKSNLSFYKVVNGFYLNLNYNIINPYGNGVSALGIVAFNVEGTQLFTNNHPWGYGNVFTAGEVNIPCDMLPTNPEGRNSIISDKGNNIYLGVNVDNINTSVSRIELDLRDENGNMLFRETPVYYPENYIDNHYGKYKQASMPLAFTYPFTGMSAPSTGTVEFNVTRANINLSLSRTFVICNGYNNRIEGYTGTTIVAFELDQRRLVGRSGKTVYDNQYNVWPEVYEREIKRVSWMHSTGGESSILTSYNIPITAENITTASFLTYNLTGTDYYVLGVNHCTGPYSTGTNPQEFKLYSLVNNTGDYRHWSVGNGVVQSGKLNFDERKIEFIERASNTFTYLYTGYFEIFNISSVYNLNDHKVYFNIIANCDQPPLNPDVIPVNNLPGNKTILCSWDGTTLNYLTSTGPHPLINNSVYQNVFFQSQIIYNQTYNRLFVVTCPNTDSLTLNYGDVEVLVYNSSTNSYNWVASYGLFDDTNNLSPRQINSFQVYRRSDNDYYIIYTLNGIYTRIIQMLIQSSTQVVFINVSELFTDNNSMNSLCWTNGVNKHEYIIGSNIEVSSYNINQYLNYGYVPFVNAEYIDIGVEKTFGSENSIFYIDGNNINFLLPNAKDYIYPGDMYAITRNFNASNEYSRSGALNSLAISWGSVLYSSDVIQIEHVSAVERNNFETIKLSSFQTTSLDEQTNKQYYIIGGSQEFGVSALINIYDISDISNKVFVESKTFPYSYLIDVGYSSYSESIIYNSRIFILQQQEFNDGIITFQDGVCKVFTYGLDGTGWYLQYVAFSDTSRRSRFVISNGQLYLVVVSGLVSSFELAIYQYDMMTREFDTYSPVVLTTISDADFLYVSALTILDMDINNQIEICVVITTVEKNYKFYFINFSTIMIDYIYNSPILSCVLSQRLFSDQVTIISNPNICEISSVKNEIDKSYKIVVQCYNQSIQDQYNVYTLEIVNVPNNVLNFNTETLTTKNDAVLRKISGYGGCTPSYSTLWNPVSKKQLLIFFESPSDYIAIYDITSDPSNLLSISDPAYNEYTYFRLPRAYSGDSITSYVYNGRAFMIETTNYKFKIYSKWSGTFSTPGITDYVILEDICSIIEISDEKYAGDFPMPCHTINYFKAQGKGYSALIKLNNDGSYQKANSFGDSYTGTNNRYDSQNVNISGLSLANSDLSIFTSLSWRGKILIEDNITEVSSNSAILFTFPIPTVSVTPSEFKSSINTTIAKTSTADMFIEYALPIYGDLDTVPTNISNASDNLGISLNTKSSTTYIYTKQLRNILQNPTIIQKILNNPTVQSSHALVINQAGTILWTASIQTIEPNIIINTNFIDTQDYIFSMISTANGKEINILNTNNQLQQIIYPFTGAENYIILTRFNNLTGQYLESNTFELHNYGQFSPSNLITSSGTNSIISSNTLVPYVDQTELNYRNKDGTLASLTFQQLRNVYSEKYFLTTEGTHDIYTPTGSFATFIKLWGAGGSCPDESLANGWSAFGGGGGYADKTLTYSANKLLRIKIGQVGQGGDIDPTFISYLSGRGGDSSTLSSFDEQTGEWIIEAVAGGGGGAGGFNGGCGGASDSPGNFSNQIKPIDNITYIDNVSIPQPGIDSGGGQGGGFGGGSGQFFVNKTTIYSNYGYGGTAGSYTLDLNILGGAGGAGYGGGGAGSPGSDNFFGYFGTGSSLGGAGGGNFGDRVVTSLTGSLEWTPANFLDEDYKEISPTGFAFAAGGFPNLDPYLGTYNPTGTNGFAVVYHFFYDFSGSTGSPNNLINLTSNYLYDSGYFDRNGKQYSTLTVYKDTNLENEIFYPYSQTDEPDLTNYFTYILGTDPVLNKNFSIRNNYYTTGTNEYTITLNSKIDTTKLTRLFVNNDTNTNWNFFYKANITKSPSYAFIQYSSGPYPNSIQVEYTSSPIDPNLQYYLLAPSLTGSIITIDVSQIIIDNSTYYIILDTLSELVTSSPFVYLVQFNESALYNLQFYPGSIIVPTYFTVNLNRLIIPNRRIRTSPFAGLRELSDFPYIYLQMFNSTGAQGEADPELVNVTFTNNPNRNKPYTNPVTNFMIPVPSMGGESLFTTLSCSIVPKIKFTPGSYTMRFRLCDPYGNPILFDNTPLKSSDSVFGTGVVDEKLLKVVYEFTFKKL